MADVEQGVVGGGSEANCPARRNLAGSGSVRAGEAAEDVVEAVVFLDQEDNVLDGIAGPGGGRRPDVASGGNTLRRREIVDGPTEGQNRQEKGGKREWLGARGDPPPTDENQTVKWYAMTTKRAPRGALFVTRSP